MSCEDSNWGSGNSRRSRPSARRETSPIVLSPASEPAVNGQACCLAQLDQATDPVARGVPARIEGQGGMWPCIHQLLICSGPCPAFLAVWSQRSLACQSCQTGWRCSIMSTKTDMSDLADDAMLETGIHLFDTCVLHPSSDWVMCCT